MRSGERINRKDERIQMKHERQSRILERQTDKQKHKRQISYYHVLMGFQSASSMLKNKNQ
jgi:hypothetical protein